MGCRTVKFTCISVNVKSKQQTSRPPRATEHVLCGFAWGVDFFQIFCFCEVLADCCSALSTTHPPSSHIVRKQFNCTRILFYSFCKKSIFFLFFAVPAKLYTPTSLEIFCAAHCVCCN